MSASAGADLPTSPGTRSRRTRSARECARRTASSTCRSARPSTRRPTVVRAALADAADAPGYPQTVGHRRRCARRSPSWFARRRGVPGLDPDAVLPTIGSKELVAWLPTLLGLGAGDVVVHPRGRLPDLRRRRAPRGRDAASVADDLDGARPADHRGTPKLVWLNSPGNPTGQVLRRRRTSPRWSPGRAQHGVVVASDECYAELGWREARAGTVAPSILDPRSAAAATRACSPSTRCPSSPTSPATAPPSSPATARSSRRLLEVRKHAGHDRARRRCSRPWSPPSATTRTWPQQKERYRRRRDLLRPALEARRLPRRPLRGRPLPLGHPRRGRVGDRRRGSPTAGILVGARARSTARPGPGTCGSRSPRPTSGSQPPPRL